eukprot:10334250-Alexandrium_andersonii.AAC.1
MGASGPAPTLSMIARWAKSRSLTKTPSACSARARPRGRPTLPRPPRSARRGLSRRPARLAVRTALSGA